MQSEKIKKINKYFVEIDCTYVRTTTHERGRIYVWLLHLENSISHLNEIHITLTMLSGFTESI